MPGAEPRRRMAGAHNGHGNGRRLFAAETRTTVMPAARGRILLIMLVAVVALAVGETLLSKGMKQIGRSGGGWLDQAMAVARNAWIGAGLLLLLVHVGLYMAALQGRRPQLRASTHRGFLSPGRTPGAIYLREDVGTARWVGIVLITAGVAIVALGDGGSDSWPRPVPAQGRRRSDVCGWPFEMDGRLSASFASIKSSRSPTTLTFASSSGVSRTRNSRSIRIARPTTSTESRPSDSRRS